MANGEIVMFFVDLSNSSQAQKVEVLDFWSSKDAIYFSRRNLEKAYNEKIRFIYF